MRTVELTEADADQFVRLVQRFQNPGSNFLCVGDLPLLERIAARIPPRPETGGEYRQELRAMAKAQGKDLA